LLVLLVINRSCDWSVCRSLTLIGFTQTSDCGWPVIRQPRFRYLSCRMELKWPTNLRKVSALTSCGRTWRLQFPTWNSSRQWRMKYVSLCFILLKMFCQVWIV